MIADTYVALDTLQERYPALTPAIPTLRSAADVLLASFQRGGKLLLAGNGGSAADCQHIAGELLKGFHLPRPLSPMDRAALATQFGTAGAELAAQLQRGLPAIALPALLALTTAMANDVHPDLVYAQGVMALGEPGDVLLAISTSGMARNVLAAARVARWKGLTVIALTGHSGGELAGCSDIVILAPGATTAEIQEFHLPIYHALCSVIEATMFS